MPLILLNAGIDLIDGLQDGDFSEWRFKAEDFYQLNTDFIWYNRAELTQRNCSFADLPLELDGDSGLRIYSSKSSNDHGVHIDLSTPMTSAPGVDSWEIELNVSNRF